MCIDILLLSPREIASSRLVLLNIEHEIMIFLEDLSLYLNHQWKKIYLSEEVQKYVIKSNKAEYTAT